MMLRRHRRHQSGNACSSGHGRRFALIAVLSAWILATGVHWDFLQVVGWGRMIVTYTTELDMSLAEAVRYTFSGDARCRICETVTEGKKASNGDPASSSTPGSPVAGKDAVGKLLLSLSPAPLGTPAVSTQTTWFAADVLEPLSPAYPVPVPPPRA
ncbi:hypothetical protein [Geminisphaera colitermitum]|uniref:hypothetical protein n=1 Tax=Geminisphaera colitermitum TaxID=1148786 RepID=UPI000693CE51|nr:hypothetical protein [Geminisphaera colitermitum]